jgi:hypothetical protein
VEKVYSVIRDMRIFIMFCFQKVLKYNQTTNPFFLFRPTHNHTQQNYCLITIHKTVQPQDITSSLDGSTNCSAALLTLSVAFNLSLLCISSISTQYLPLSISIYTHNVYISVTNQCSTLRTSKFRSVTLTAAT